MSTQSFPLKKPLPDFKAFEKVLKGEKKPEKVHFVEWGVDLEIRKFIVENIMKEKWIPPISTSENNSIAEKKLFTNKKEQELWKQRINFYYRMGYDYVPSGVPGVPLPPLDTNTDLLKKKIGKKADDTAILSMGKRSWAEEGRGIITSWKDFEEFPWREMKIRIKNYNFENYSKFLHENLPDGMKTMMQGSLFEQVLERLLGYEGLFYSLYDQPDLVEAVFNAWGEITYELYEHTIPIESVGGIFHADDLGYKTATMLNPDILRKLVFPWFKKYASLAHKYGKMYWYHCCGNVLEVMEDLIEDVKIDAFHSFQDVIIPVGKFMKKYGDRVAILGGIDMDKLGRMDEKELKKYVRNTLEECMPSRYALGSGNTVANYIPVENYFIMLDEGQRWGDS